MNKLIVVLVSVLCTGCATFRLETSGNKFYLHSEVFPTITNDKKFELDKTESNKILLRGRRIEYHYRF